MLLTEFNSLERAAAIDTIEGCCASEAWSGAVVGRRPYGSMAALEQASAEIWSALSEADYLQAFDGHPKIGDPDSLKKKYAATHAMASNEQSGVAGAPQSLILDLARYNQEYENKFGFIFIVCATGKSAAQMLELVKQRLPNNRDTELANAATEQHAITALRLAALFGQNA